MKTVDDHNYMNFEFNCIGTCDAARRQSRDIKRSLNTDEYTSIRRYSSIENKPFSEKTGVFSWELVVSIPFRLMGLDPENLPEKSWAISTNVQTIRNIPTLSAGTR